MQEGSSRAERTPSRTARVAGAVIVVVIVVAVVAVALFRGRGATDPWVAGFEAVDTGVVAADAGLVNHDLGQAPSSVVTSLRFDCEIGRRDAARLLSHRLPANAALRRVYETVLQENWRMYAGCTSALASNADVGTLTTRLESDLRLLRRDEARVNAVARTVAYAPVFSSLG